MPAPAPKSVIVLSATAVTVTNSNTTAAFDTKGYDYCVLDVMATTTDAATDNFSVLTLSEGDTTAAYVAFSTGDTDFTIATQSTTVNAIVAQFRLDLRARKRWLKLSITNGLYADPTVWAHAQLYRGDSMPVSAAQSGVDALINL
jgi:hypothetical protein